MKLMDMTVNAYLDTVASDAPAPGGGSASALCGAQGASLAAMVAGLTVGKKKYAEHWEFCAAAREQALELARKLAVQVDRDTEAFNLVSAAYKLPRETDAEKSARAAAIADATVHATEEPLETMRLALAALRVAASLIGRFNTTAASDLGVAALNLRAAADGAHFNVLINLSGLADDGSACRYRDEAGRITSEVYALFDALQEAVLAQM